MPRVTHVKKARKDNPVCKAGESYYWWKFRYGGKHYSLTPPRASQLTQSAYLSVIYDAQEDWGNLADPTGLVASEFDQDYASLVTQLNDTASSMESCAENLRELVSQYEESADNMEEYFQGSEKIDTLRECGQNCEMTCDSIDEMHQGVTDAATTIDSLIEDARQQIDDDDEEDETVRSENIVSINADLESQIDDELQGITFEDPDWDFHEV